MRAQVAFEEVRGRPDGDHRHRAAVPGEQGDPAREDRRPGQGQEDRRHRRPARRVRPRRDAHLRRDQARRQPAQGPEQPVQAHPDAAGVQHEHAGPRRRPAPDAAAAQRARSTTSSTGATSSAAGPSSTCGKARARAHILEGLKIALDNLDAVIKTIRESREVEDARNNLMKRFKLSEVQAQAILDMRLARLAALERKKIEDEYLPVIQLIAELEDILANPARVLRDHQGRAGRAEEEVRRRAPDPGRRRRQPRDDRRGPHRRRGRRRDDLRPRLHQAPAGRHLPPPAPRRQGDHRPRHARGGRRRAPARGQHPRLGAVLHQPRARVQRQGPRHPGRQPAGQGHGHHQPARRPGGIGRGPDGDDRPARTSSPATTWSSRRARASSRRRRSSSSSGCARPGIRAITIADDDELAWVDVSTGADDIIIATAQGMLARFEEGEVRAMGRDAAGVIGIRLLKKEGDSVVAMSVVEADADLLVLTETGYGKRVAIDEFRRKHRGGQGVRLIALEGTQDRRRRRRPAGHRGRRGARPHLRGRPGHPDRDEHDQPLLVERARRHRHAPGRGRPGRGHRRVPARTCGPRRHGRR